MLPLPDSCILERFEGDWALVEGPDGTLHQLPASQLPPGAIPGHRLLRQGDGWAIDEEETQSRKRRIEEQMQRLFKNKP